MTPEHSEKTITDIIHQLTGFMSLSCQVVVTEEKPASANALASPKPPAERGSAGKQGENTSFLVSVTTPENARFLIGKNGQNLRALEHLVRTIFYKTTKTAANITLDVNDYRRTRALQAIESARQAVSRVRSNRKAEALFPMTAYERRVVHMELASCPDIATESIGDEPQRRVVIKPFP